MKAEYIGRCFNRNGTKNLFYSYRGHEYVITDNGWKGGAPLAQQRHEEQTRIDALIEDESTITKEEVEISPVDVAIAEFWEYCEK